MRKYMAFRGMVPPPLAATLLAALLAAIFLDTFTLQAHVLEEAWHKYAPLAEKEQPKENCPGLILGPAPGKGESAHSHVWKYRAQTFEIHYARPAELARSIYSLALFVHDVSPNLPREKFYGGVLGFHYEAAQIAAWLNHALAEHAALSPEENAFAGYMLRSGIVKIGEKGFEPGGKINHVLGAAPGKKRKFAENLRHERLHVFWDEDEAFREREMDAWNSQPEAEKEKARGELKNYDPKNESQLVEEWAIKRAEKSGMSINK